MNVLERKIADCAYSVLGFASPCWESSGALGCSGSPNGAYKREGRERGGGILRKTNVLNVKNLYLYIRMDARMASKSSHKGICGREPRY